MVGRDEGSRGETDAAARRRDRRRVSVAAFALALAVAMVDSAAAQSAGDQGYLDSRQRAEQDWELLSQSASSLWDQTTEALTPMLANPAFAVATLSAALLGGLFGAWARGAPAKPSRPAAVDAPKNRREARLRRDENDGLIFRPSGPKGGRARVGDADDDAAEEPSREAPRPADVPMAPRRPDAAAGEAARLFRFFEERFGLRERSASAAIAFFSTLSRSIDTLRQRAEEAESERDRLRAQPAGAPAAAAAAGAESDAPDAAAWRMISDGVRLCRAVLQQHKASDRELARFENVVELEETLLGLAEARAGALHSGRGIEPGVIEQGWPHALFRAEALLQTYYPGHGPWGELRESVSLMAAPVRRLLRGAGVSVVSATLLAPFAPEDGERWSDAAEDLTELEYVRGRLAGAVERERRPFVIDCETFGYRDARRGVSTRSRLILLDPEEWE